MLLLQYILPGDRNLPADLPSPPSFVRCSGFSVPKAVASYSVKSMYGTEYSQIGSTSSSRTYMPDATYSDLDLYPAVWTSRAKGGKRARTTSNFTAVYAHAWSGCAREVRLRVLLACCGVGARGEVQPRCSSGL